MGLAADETNWGEIRVGSNRRVKLESHDSRITADAGLRPFEAIDDAPALTETAAATLSDVRIGKNGRHSIAAQLPQPEFGRMAGYADVNDAGRLTKAPEIRWLIGERAITNQKDSASHSLAAEADAMSHLACQLQTDQIIENSGHKAASS